jgi:hypothetical protein
MIEEKKFRVSYNKERLIIDEDFRNEFMSKIGAIGHFIEKIYDDEP